MTFAIHRVSRRRVTLILALALALASGYVNAQQRQRRSQPPSPSAAQGEKPNQNADQRGTEDKPVVVKVLPVETTAAERAQEAQDRSDKASADWWMVRLTAALAGVGVLQFLALIGQAIVFLIQARRLRESVDLTRTIADRQAQDMTASIGQATRSAAAMEGVATAMSQNLAHTREMLGQQRRYAQMQLRSYLSVIIGTAVYQETGKDIRFEAKPTVVNTGQTPAQNVVMNLRAEILPIPAPAGFAFPLPAQGQPGAEIGPRQERLLSAIVDGFVLDPDVPRIKQGHGAVLAVWGTITYSDVFGDPHTTNFGQLLTWTPDGRIFGLFTAEHNNSD